MKKYGVDIESTVVIAPNSKQNVFFVDYKSGFRLRLGYSKILLHYVGAALIVFQMADRPVLGRAKYC